MATNENAQELVQNVSSPTSGLPPPEVVSEGVRPHRQRSRGSSSSRRSGHRSRHRHRSNSHRRPGRINCRLHLKDKERNFLAASFSMVSVVLLCISLEPDWIYMEGGGCQNVNEGKGTLHNLNPTRFFYTGYFYKKYSGKKYTGDTFYKFGSSTNDVMVNCVTYISVPLLKASIAFIFISILFSLAAFLLDLFGPKYHILKTIKRNAIFNILTVVLCVAVNLFIYWISSSLCELQKMSKVYPGSTVIVKFDAGFYLITAAAGVSVISVACNCLRRYPLYENQEAAATTNDDLESLLQLPVDNSPPNLPPPPAYTP